MAGFFTVLGLGAVYFVGAIPAGTAMGMTPLYAALVSWAGYTAAAVAMVFIGMPARRWLSTKLRLPEKLDSKKWYWRAWEKWGMAGLGLLAPVTCGSYTAALLSLALGERPLRVIFWISYGLLPWGMLFAALTAAGVSFIQK